MFVLRLILWRYLRYPRCGRLETRVSYWWLIGCRLRSTRDAWIQPIPDSQSEIINPCNPACLLQHQIVRRDWRYLRSVDTRAFRGGRSISVQAIANQACIQASDFLWLNLLYSPLGCISTSVGGVRTESKSIPPNCGAQQSPMSRSQDSQFQ